MAPSQMTPEQKEFVARLTEVVGRQVEDIEDKMRVALQPLLDAQRETNEHLARLNGTVAHLVEFRQAQEKLNEKLAACASDADKRLTVIERVSDIKVGYVERGMNRVEGVQERLDDKVDRRHEWTVGQILGLVGAVSAVTAVVQVVVSMVMK